MTDPFSPYRDAVVRSLERRFGSRELAEDAVQDAFAIALAKPEPPPNPKAWLHVVAHRRAVDVLRGVREAPHAAPPETGCERDPLEVLSMREEVRSVFGALHRIPGRQRDALLLRSLEGRTYDEIGARLDIAPANAKQLVSRARHSLCLTVEADGIDCAAVRRELQAAVQRNTRAPVLVRPHLKACRECARCHADLRSAARRRRLGALLPVPLLNRLTDLMQRTFEVTAGTAAGRACAGVCAAAGAFATFGPAPVVIQQVAQAPPRTTATPTPTPIATPARAEQPRRKPKSAPTPAAAPIIPRTPVLAVTPTPTPAPETPASIHAEYRECKRDVERTVACLGEAVERQRALASAHRGKEKRELARLSHKDAVGGPELPVLLEEAVPGERGAEPGKDRARARERRAEVDGEIDRRRGVQLGEARPDRREVAVGHDAQGGPVEPAAVLEPDPAAGDGLLGAGEGRSAEAGLEDELARERRRARELRLVG